MKTYAESQNKPPFDWNAELQKKIDGQYSTDRKTWQPCTVVEP